MNGREGGKGEDRRRRGVGGGKGRKGGRKRRGRGSGSQDEEAGGRRRGSGQGEPETNFDRNPDFKENVPRQPFRPRPASAGAAPSNIPSISTWRPHDLPGRPRENLRASPFVQSTPRLSAITHAPAVPGSGTGRRLDTRSHPHADRTSPPPTHTHTQDTRKWRRRLPLCGNLSQYVHNLQRSILLAFSLQTSNTLARVNASAAV